MSNTTNLRKIYLSANHARALARVFELGSTENGRKLFPGLDLPGENDCLRMARKWNRDAGAIEDGSTGRDAKQVSNDPMECHHCGKPVITDVWGVFGHVTREDHINCRSARAVGDPDNMARALAAMDDETRAKVLSMVAPR
ncbi:hypothetical protein ND748_03445 [Frankia sp. AiPs1]|uniref:hypothetical protein n=1 Tax=Frankia sp. AiPs1 TaxID=573493 RepID=UPI0020445C9D|nr:hypothetical protein [Frankia sp. AiPs1]MCM3920731.1 hypothetical protein [Frankia sp. AiPs1]